MSEINEEDYDLSPGSVGDDYELNDEWIAWELCLYIIHPRTWDTMFEVRAPVIRWAERGIR